jgi:phage terminase small subunit
MAGLTAKQEAFCNEYLIDLNATQAAIRAGYSAKTAHVIGTENLGKPGIQAYLEIRMKDREKRTEINADYVLKRLAEIDRMDVADILNTDGSMKPVSDWPEVWRRSISGMDVSELFNGSGNEKVLAGLLKKIKFPDKLKNLELMGKHVSVGAFKETVDNRHSFVGPDGKPLIVNVTTVSVSVAGRKTNV